MAHRVSELRREAADVKFIDLSEADDAASVVSTFVPFSTTYGTLRLHRNIRSNCRDSFRDVLT